MGWEGLRSMTKKTFGVFVDATGRKYFSQITGECDKNHTIKDSTSESSGEGRLHLGESTNQLRGFQGNNF